MVGTRRCIRRCMKADMYEDALKAAAPLAVRRDLTRGLRRRPSEM